MVSPKKTNSTVPSQPVAQGPDHATRAKHLRPRTPPVVVAAREDVSRIFRRAIETHHASTRVASILNVSPQLVRAWSDPSDDHSPQVAQVVAVFVAGQRALVLGFWEDVRAYLESIQGASGHTRAEHVVALQVALGAAAEATRDDDAAKYRSALHDVLIGARGALADEEPSKR